MGEALFAEELQEDVHRAGRARAGDRHERLDDQRGLHLAAHQQQAAGDAQLRLEREVGLRLLPGAAGDGPHRALELLLGDRDHLRGDAGGVREGEHRRLLADEQHGAGAFPLAVAGGAARGAVVGARGVVAPEQAVRFFVADLGAYFVADVEHARHGGSSYFRCVGGGVRAVPGS
ncbi:hypothetical protein GCM10020221_00320 [Streptomyces thioluteus]|uniref:Uncharacterized protein n=1 Tax=Streptomyces thioluteus TaxID=66431 RepID=A0ABN3WB96_STRTU